MVAYLQGAVYFRDQTGEAYWCYVRQADRGGKRRLRICDDQ